MGKMNSQTSGSEFFENRMKACKVPSVDLLYQDISQRNQADIFISNIKQYLKKGGTGVLMIKARSIDVSLKPEEAYDLVYSKLKSEGLKVIEKIDLKPYEKDHACISIFL